MIGIINVVNSKSFYDSIGVSDISNRTEYDICEDIAKLTIYTDKNTNDTINYSKALEILNYDEIEENLKKYKLTGFNISVYDKLNQLVYEVSYYTNGEIEKEKRIVTMPIFY